MGFENLLYRQMEQGTFEQFEEYCKNLVKADPRYGDVFLYAMALADEVSHSYFRDQVMLIGGFGVLGHMIEVEGPEVVKYWRGSHDLDIVCQNHQALAYVLNQFAREEHQSLSLPDKKTVKLVDSTIEEMVGRSSICDADIYYPTDKRNKEKIRVGNKQLQAKDFEGALEIDVYDTTFRIHDEYGLLSMKLGVVTSENLPRPKDITDIFNLLGVCERRKQSAAEVYATLSDEERMKLMEIFHYSPQSNNRYVLLAPSTGFINELEDLFKSEKSPSVVNM